MEKKTITVTIFNEQYNLTTELPKKETEAIAEMVDKKMRLILPVNFINCAKNMKNFWRQLKNNGECDET